MQADTQWHLDKKVPIALILVILAQTAAAGLVAGNFQARVNSLEDAQKLMAPQAERLTRLEVKLETALDNLSEIKRLVQQRR